MKKLFILITIGIFSNIFSQEKKFQPIYYVDYQYAGKNQLKVGNEFVLYNDKDENFPNVLLFGIGYGILYNNKNIQGISDVHVTYQQQSVLFARIGCSEKHLYSTAGFSLFNGMDFSFGYSANFQKKNEFLSGFTFGITLRITNKKYIYPSFNFLM